MAQDPKTVVRVSQRNFQSIVKQADAEDGPRNLPARERAYDFSNGRVFYQPRDLYRDEA